MEVVKLFHRICIVVALLSIAVFAKDAILVLHPPGNDFIQTLESIKQGVGSELWVANKTININDEWSSVKDYLAKVSPKALVLMDNQAVAMYRQHVEECKRNGKTPIPAVALMALQLSKVSGELKINGISYEIPVVTSVVNLRAISSKPIRSVGVIYRKSWESFIKQNTEYCKTEQIELIGHPISDGETNMPSAIANGLYQLLNSKKVDALWILSDNILLNNQTLVKGWIPAVGKSTVPVIVGVETLVQTKFGLGSFAVLPDHSGLGSQAVNMIYEMMDNSWKIDRATIDQPLSVVKTVNSTLARKKGFLNESGLRNVDREVR